MCQYFQGEGEEFKKKSRFVFCLVDAVSNFVLFFLFLVVLAGILVLAFFSLFLVVCVCAREFNP